MTVEEAKAMQGRVMKLAQKHKKAMGRRMINSEDILSAWETLYEQNDHGDMPFFEWRRNIINTSMGHTNGTSSETAPDTSPKPFLYRYSDLALKHDKLPKDEMINDMWGCGDGTLSSARGRLRKIGFDFLPNEDGTWTVTKRPIPPPTPVETPKQETLLTSLPSVAQPPVLKSDTQLIIERLDTIIFLLHGLDKAWS